ncbi:hypothetical protein [Salinigranum rubrum]|nr:hypothetical protein [Salinigranum rubrum]
MADIRCCACGEQFATEAEAQDHFMSEPPKHFFEVVEETDAPD